MYSDGSATLAASNYNGSSFGLGAGPASRVCVCELLAEAEERTTALHGIIAGGSHVRIWMMD